MSFHGTNADEELNVSGTVLDLAMPTQIVTGGGDDRVVLENYLPANVDLGDGYDTLTYLACHRAYVALAVSAECLTAGAAEVSTALAGVEYFHGARPTVSPCKGATGLSGSRRLPGMSWSTAVPVPIGSSPSEAGSRR